MRGYPCVGGPCARIPLIIQGALSVEKIPGVEQVRDAFLLCVRIDADNVFSKGGDVLARHTDRKIRAIRTEMMMQGTTPVAVLSLRRMKSL